MFVSIQIAGEKKQKVSEIKAGLDDADVLVLYAELFLYATKF